MNSCDVRIERSTLWFMIHITYHLVQNAQQMPKIIILKLWFFCLRLPILKQTDNLIRIVCESVVFSKYTFYFKRFGVKILHLKQAIKSVNNILVKCVCLLFCCLAKCERSHILSSCHFDTMWKMRMTYTHVFVYFHLIGLVIFIFQKIHFFFSFEYVYF